MSKNAPLISLAYTSVRPRAIAEVMRLWDERSVLKQHEWVISVDDGNEAVLKAAALAVSPYSGTYLNSGSITASITVNAGAKNCVHGWNRAAACTTGKIIIAVADDFVPPIGWDTALQNLEPKGWEDGDYVVKVEDGYVHNIFVLAILTRKRYERFGYIFYPKYESMFCDTELGEVAQRDGVVLDANHLLFEHQHPDCNKRPRDNNDLVHASQQRWDSGQMLYNFRRAQNFPLDDGPKAEATPVKVEEKSNNDRYVAYMQVTKDDICLLDVCRRLASEGVRDFCFCQPDKYWSGEALEPKHVQEIASVVATLQAENLTVHHQMFHVEHYQMPNDSRIVVETRVRNASLEWIRTLGYQHILIIDGDELWMPGALKVIKGYVEQGHPAISCRMIPVIGLPGYPVDFASDVAVVYIAKDVVFKVCRSPYIKQTVIHQPLIYHFTGTRKNMEDTVQKHRRSGHYDDPDYDFEGWLKDTLPQIKPGAKNVHMYKPYQIWPVVRAWRTGELESMPESIRAYLGDNQP